MKIFYKFFLFVLFFQSSSAQQIEWWKTYYSHWGSYISPIIFSQQGNIFFSGFANQKDTFNFGDTILYTDHSSFYNAKFDQNGNCIWASDSLYGTIFGVDDNENVYFCKSIMNIDSTWDYDIIKTDPDGVIIWQKNYGHAGNERVNGEIFQNRILLYGNSYSDTSYDDLGYHREFFYKIIYSFIDELDIDGNQIHHTEISSTECNDLFYLRVDSKGNYILGGFYKGIISIQSDFGLNYIDLSSNEYKNYIIKLSESFIPLWSHAIVNLANNNRFNFEVDKNNNIFISGRFLIFLVWNESDTLFSINSNSGSSYFTYLLKLNENGDLVWNKIFSSTGYAELAGGITFNNENILVTGAFLDSANFDGQIKVSHYPSNYEFYIATFNQVGHLISYFSNGSSQSSEYGETLSAIRGNIFFATVDYLGIPIINGVEICPDNSGFDERYLAKFNINSEGSIVDGVIDCIFYPNPTDDLLNFDYYADSSEEVLFNIFDLRGVLVKTVKKNLFVGYNYVQVSTLNLPASMYFINVKCNNELKYKKFVKVTTSY